MQLKETLRLRKEWGNKPCDHPHIEKEYDLGGDTGDKVCTTCGRAVIDMHGNKVGPDKDDTKKDSK